MKKSLILSLTLFTFGTTLLPISTVVNADTVKTSSSQETLVQTYYISNSEYFKYAEENGVDVKGILGEKAYQQALKEDNFKQGKNWIKIYQSGKEKRISMGVNSALVKVWKYGGQAAIYAIQAYGAAVGMPLDPMVANGMHNQLKTIDSSRGYQWKLGTKPWRIISNGYQ